MIGPLAERLSAEHAREIDEVSGLPVRAALELSLAASVEAYAFVSPDTHQAVFMMGVEAVSPITSGAMVWMLGTAEIARRPAAVLRSARWGVDRAFAVTGALRLEQYIPAWYRTGLRFVQRLGFGLEPSGLRGGRDGVFWRAVMHRPI